MALSGSNTQTVPGTGGYISIRFDWTASQNISGNYSDVTVKVYVVRGSYGYNTNSTADETILWIDGTKYTGTSSIGGASNTTSLLMERTKRVYHNADGTKSFSIDFQKYFGLSWGGTWVGTVYFDAITYTLNTIPRATTPILSNYDPVMGSTITIDLPRASSSFTHYVFHDFWVGSWTQINQTAVGTSLQWTVPLEEYALRIPNSASGGGRIQVDTWNGSTFIGSKIVNFTANVPSFVIPTIDTVTVAEAVAGLAAKFGAYVQFKSKLAISMAASGMYGSTISSYKITANGTTYNAASATTNELVASGADKVIFEATDSRGRKATQTVTITVVTYSQPSVLSIGASRVDASGASDDEGIYAKVFFKTAIAPVNNLNDKLLEIKMRKVGTESWTTAYSDSTAYAYDTFQLLVGFDGDFAYDIQVTVTDYFSGTNPATLSTTLSTAFTLVDYFAGGKGLAFGKVANKDGFENALKTWFTGGIETVALPIGDGTLLYWQGIPGGFYHAVLGSVTGQPRPSGLIHIIRNNGDFSAVWYDDTSDAIYRLRGSTATISGWVLIAGNPTIFRPALLNGWKNYPNYEAAGYYKDSNNRVQLCGLIELGNAASGITIFQLPVGFRPAYRELFPIYSGGTIGRVDVLADGNVVVQTGDSAFLSLSGISFLAKN